jgi:mannonate dehydratase
MNSTHTHTLNRRRALGCCAGLASGLFTSLQGMAQADTPAWLQDERLQHCLQGLDAAQLWDVHTHLLGTGDAGSGCRVHPHMAQWWHPVEHLRKRMIMGAAGVPADTATVDNTYVTRLAQLASQFPAGARWMLFAFDDALDDAGQVRNGWTTFHVPNAHAQVVARQHPDRFEWVASIHPYRADALQRLDVAIAGGARAVKWLPSAMNIDLRDARCQPFYIRLAASGLPLIVHCGEEKAVPGAGRDDLGNPLLVRAPLAQGVRVIVAHCASLGDALDLDQRRPTMRPAFDLFARVMDEADGRARLLGDVSAVFQSNRSAEVAQTVITRANGDWRGRLLHGSDYPLPGVGWLYRLGGLVRAGLLDERSASWLPTLQPQNPLMFDLALKRCLRWQGQGLPEDVFATRTHWARSATPTPTTTLTAGLP